MNKDIILFSSYSFIILIFFIIGYFIGKNKNNKFEYGLFGLFIGVIVCFILWMTVIEKIYKKYMKDDKNIKHNSKNKNL